MKTNFKFLFAIFSIFLISGCKQHEQQDIEEQKFVTIKENGDICTNMSLSYRVDDYQIESEKIKITIKIEKLK
jgi:hypothetical protein